MPGRQQSEVIMFGASGTSPGAAVARSSSSSSTAARVVVPRLLAVAVLAAAVAVIAALGGYARGRGTVDSDALQAKAYAAGHAAGLNDARHEAAAARARAKASAPPVGRGGSHVITGPSAEMRAQLRRAYAAGGRAAAFKQRAHGRLLGAEAALGNFSGGWATGRWYMVRLAPGSTLTGGQPRLTSRVGPLSNGQGFRACHGGQEVCVVGKR